MNAEEFFMFLDNKDVLNPSSPKGGCKNPQTVFTLVLKIAQPRGKIAPGTFNLSHIAWLYNRQCLEGKLHASYFNSFRNCQLFMTAVDFIFNTPNVHFAMKLRSWYVTMWHTPTWRYATMQYSRWIVTVTHSHWFLTSPSSTFRQTTSW